MTALEIGNQLVQLCKMGRNAEAVEELYDQDNVCVEAESGDGSNETRGLQAVKEKNKAWREGHEVRNSRISGPFPHGDKFAVVFHSDITFKSSGDTKTMEEVGVYTVKDDKIVREEFYYNMQQ